MQRKSIIFIFKSIITCFLILCCGLVAYRQYNIFADRLPLYIYRMAFFTAVFAFLFLNLYIPIKKLYAFIFKHRFLIGLLVIVLLVGAKINFSNLAMWNAYIQPSNGSDFVSPIFGTARAIRSDEWAVSLPRTLTYWFCQGEKYNDIVSAAATPNLSATLLYPSISALATPFHLGYYFLGAEYGLSFYFASFLVVTVLSGIQFFLIITNNKPILSVAGASLIAFSPFFLWWSFCSVITYGITAVVCIYEFIHADKTFKRILFALLVSVFGAAFVCLLYPAWQVPAGYVFLGLIIWFLITGFEKIKKFRFSDWLIFASALLLAAVIVAFYLYNETDYLTAISQTLYPGKRSLSGGYSLYKLFYYTADLKLPFDDANICASECGTFLTLFPLPIILGVYSLFKKRDKLIIILLICSIFLGIYCTCGYPQIIAKLLLLTYSTPKRAIDFLAFVQLILLWRSLALSADFDFCIPKPLALIIALFTEALTFYMCRKYQLKDGYLSTAFICAACVISLMIIYLIITRNKGVIFNAAIVSLAVINLISGIYVLPIQKGLDPIYSKPAAQKTLSITKENPDAVWLSSGSWVTANFYSACGAKVINSNNYMPNIKFWQKLFPKERYEKIYNRYANVEVEITADKTELELVHNDQIKFYVSYNDLDDIGVSYIASSGRLSAPVNCENKLLELYGENGVFIYEVADSQAAK